MSTPDKKAADKKPAELIFAPHSTGESKQRATFHKVRDGVVRNEYRLFENGDGIARSLKEGKRIDIDVNQPVLQVSRADTVTDRQQEDTAQDSSFAQGKTDVQTVGRSDGESMGRNASADFSNGSLRLNWSGAQACLAGKDSSKEIINELKQSIMLDSGSTCSVFCNSDMV